MKKMCKYGRAFNSFKKSETGEKANGGESEKETSQRWGQR